MSSALEPIPTTKKAGKKRRPTFRPARSGKSTTNKDSTPALAAAAARSDEETPPPPPVEPESHNHEEEESPLSQTPTKRTKKRKVVSIGSSRPEEPAMAEVSQQQHVLVGGEEASDPVVALEPQVPVAVPGQPKLKTFCSRYRTKEKRKHHAQKTPKASTARQQENAPAEQPTSAASAGPVVQVVNGEIVLQESSMVVPGARRSVQEVEEELEEVVEEEAHSAVVGASYNSFVSRRAPQHWTVEETKKFYDALRQVGPDFATMAAYFENRTRKQLKRKYQMESTKHPHLVELALSPQARVPLDLTVFNVEVPAAADRADTDDATTPSAETPVESQPSDSQPPESRAQVEQSSLAVEPPSTNQQSVGMIPPILGPHEPAEAGENEVEAMYLPEQVEVPGTTTVAAIPPLPPTTKTTKAKRPKFKASRSKAKSKS